MSKRDWVLNSGSEEFNKLIVWKDDGSDGFSLHMGGVYTDETMSKFVSDHESKDFYEIKEWTEKTFRSLSDQSTWLMCYFGECK